MRKIGVIGGMSWQSTAQYYRLLNEGAQERLSGLHSARLVLIATNTMHKVYDAVVAAVSCPVLHLADVTADAVRRQGLDRVALLATSYTMEQEFYRGRLRDAGVETLVPAPADRAEVQRIIFEELCLGMVRPESRDRMVAICEGLLAGGGQGVVLGCTELSIRPTDLHAPVFATTGLHCSAALDVALAP